MTRRTAGNTANNSRTGLHVVGQKAPYALNTSHEVRAKWLSDQLQRLDPIKKQPDFDIVWDLYLLCLERVEAEKTSQETAKKPRRSASVRYRGTDVPIA